MYKILTLLTLVIFSYCFGQPLRNKYQNINYDSIAKSNIGRYINQSENEGIYKVQPSERFKLTISTKVSNNPFQNGISNMTFNDILFAGSYDIRARFYVTQNLKVFQRVFITGLNNQNIFYTTGIIIKF